MTCPQFYRIFLEQSIAVSAVCFESMVRSGATDEGIDDEMCL